MEGRQQKMKRDELDMFSPEDVAPFRCNQRGGL